MNNSIPLIVSSCDQYCDLWQSFFSLVKKYWTGFDRKVYLCTQSKTFKYGGLDINCPLRMPLDSTWSARLLALLEQINDEFVLFMLDDFWLKTQIDVDRLMRYEKIMMDDSNIGFICLIHQLEPSVGNPVSSYYPDLIVYGQNTPYRVTTQAGLWRKDYLRSLLRKYESAWWFEMFGSKRSRKSSYKSYVVKDSVFSYDDGGVLLRGSYVSEYMKYFAEEKNIVINPQRRIASRDVLKGEINDISFFQKLNPIFIYHYCKSHF